MSVGMACALGSHNEVYPPSTLLILSILLHLLYKVDVIVLTVALFSRPRAVFVLHGGCCRGLLALQCPDPQSIVGNALLREATFLFNKQ